LGKKLAKKLDYQFIDLDTELIKSESKTIPEIFEQKGESYFRAIESDWLQKNITTNAVISLGGGAACFNDNIKLINDSGISVYLKMKPSSLAIRLLNSKQKRPLIDDIKHNEDLLKAKIIDLLEQREIYYNQARLIFNPSYMTPEKLELLVDKINAFYF
jgi:shikimate kinase